ncbi:MAG: type VI secretion system contractile sheath small subunit [Rubrivivax sp.]|nr:type VI secretion system contractile sheath small subunit [Rubrivivax sp.]
MSESQKFIGRNRAPRVQINYELEQYGAKKLVELPFIVGVMSDLAGKSESDEAKKAAADRKFLEIDVDNFDSRMDKLRPKVAFQVENTLSGEGNIPVAIDFASMDDFSPVKVAQKVAPLAKLVEARNQLSSLLTFMDGKADAEGLLAKVLEDQSLLKAIADAPMPAKKADGDA